MSERKLASVQRIAEIQPIEGADKIVKARINDWWVVTAITNGFNVGDLVIYLEIDSWVPNEIAPFLTKPGQFPKVYQGVEGQRLKTIKLRGQLSQGLILPLHAYKAQLAAAGFVHYNEGEDQTRVDAVCGGGLVLVDEGTDLTETLGILKWERELPANLAGLARGSFPSFIPKTDQERIQNIGKQVFEQRVGEFYEVTIKLDGSSITIYKNEDTVGVCSRNLNLKLEQEGNLFVDTATKTEALSALQRYCEDNNVNYAIQGELMGPGIQGNRENLTNHEIYIFDVYNIDTQEYLDAFSRSIVLQDLISKYGAKINQIPLLGHVTLEDLNLNTVGDILKYAEGPSLTNKVREGVVFKSHDDTSFSFKAISNKFLLDTGE